MAKVFISYSRTNKDIVDSICEDLSSMDYQVWLDKELTGGHNWWNQILENIRKLEVFIFVLSPSSVDSTACRREYEYANKLNKPIIPVLVDETVSVTLLPPELSKIQIVNYSLNDKKSSFNLIKSCSNVPISPLPEPLPEPPEIPISYLGLVTQKITSDEKLSLEKQTYLFGEIKRHSNDKESSTDNILTLLKKLRRRRDLYSSVADDIDILLNKIDNTHPAKSDRNINELLEENIELKKEIYELSRENKDLDKEIIDGNINEANEKINELTSENEQLKRQEKILEGTINSLNIEKDNLHNDLQIRYNLLVEECPDKKKLKDIFTTDNSFINSMLAYTDNLVEQGSYNESQILLNNTISMYPNYLYVRFKLAVCYWKKDSYESFNKVSQDFMGSSGDNKKLFWVAFKLLSLKFPQRSPAFNNYSLEELEENPRLFFI